MSTADPVPDPLIQALAAGDLAAAEEVVTSLRQNSEEDAGRRLLAEALYRVGTYLLFAHKDLARSAERFREVAKLKCHPISSSARVCLGSILLRSGKPQQAMFEFRKVIAKKPANMMAVQAAGMLVIALRDVGKLEDAARARKTLLATLDDVCGHSDKVESAAAWYYLGMERNAEGDHRGAAEAFRQAVASNGLAPPELSRVQKMLEERS